jgi:uncharacterized protein YndB with AHSA1/START domain/dihydrofolate reductase
MTVTAVRKDSRRLTLTVEAEFDAPVERIWQLWADPRLLERWWGPPTYPATFTKHDLVPGARVEYHMTGPAGDQPHGSWDVLEVEPPRRIVIRDTCTDAGDAPGTDAPINTIRVDIVEIAQGRTRMTIETVFPSTEAMERALAMGTDEGLGQAVGQIDAILAEDSIKHSIHRRAVDHVNHIHPTPDSAKGAIMKLTTVTNVSVDGVMQGLGGQDEDRRGGFERGGWALPLFDGEAATFLGQIYQRADAFLFGRQTYEIFAGSWGTWDDPGDSPIWTALNTKPKYVASTTLTDPQWADTTVLSGDTAEAIGELKARPAGELQVHGSGNLARWLFDNELVDEIILLTYPLIVGQGARLFPDTGPDTALDLVDSRATPGGVTIQVYRPTGPPKYAGATAED